MAEPRPGRSTPGERRLDRLEARLSQLEGAMRLSEVNTTTRLNSIDAKLAYLSSVADGISALVVAIQGPAYDPDQGLIARLRSIESWRSELGGSLKLIKVIASLAALAPIVLAAARLATMGHL